MNSNRWWLFAAFAKSLLREGAALARPSALQRHILVRWVLLLLEGLGGLPEDELPAGGSLAVPSPSWAGKGLSRYRLRAPLGGHIGTALGGGRGYCATA